MRILIDLTCLNDNFSGIERFALNISLNMLKNRLDEEYFILFKNEIYPDFIGLENEKVHFIVQKGKNKLIFSQVLILKTLYAIKADYYLFLAFPAPLLFFSKKSISAIHDLGCWDCPETMTLKSVVFFRVLYYKASLFAKKIITVSNFSKQRIKEILKVKEENIMVIYNGISDTFTKELGNDEVNVKKKYNLPKEYILCLSTLEPRKNLSLMISAFDSLLIEGKLDFDLVLVGRKGWKFENVMNGVDKKTTSRIHFTGFIDDEDLPIVYKMARLFVFPSIYEGFGIPPLEALYMGQNVLVSDLEVFKEIFGDHVNYFISNDINDLKTQILHTLNLGNEKKLILKDLFEVFNWDLQSKNLLDYLRSK